MEKKICLFCYLEKDLGDFYSDAQNKASGYCKKCDLFLAKLKHAVGYEQKNDYRARKAEAAKKYRETHAKQQSNYYKQWYAKTKRYRVMPDGSVAERIKRKYYIDVNAGVNEVKELT